MSRWIGAVLVFFFLVLLAGCTKEEDKLIDKEIEIKNRMSEILESVTDDASRMDAMKNLLPPVMDEFNKVHKELTKLPGYPAAFEAHKEKLKEADDRFAAAKRQAANAGRKSPQ
jgi:hypothetical protein